MQYSIENYGITFKRGHVRKDGMKLWGIRRYKGKRILDWRTQKIWEKNDKNKMKRTRERHAKVRAKITAIKMDRGCEQCGFSINVFKTSKERKAYYNHVASILQFDHLDKASKLYNVCDMSGRSWSTIQREINKCRVLCFPCHTNHSAEQRKGDSQ